MKIQCEVSRPHYHPGKDFDMKVTKKRDLSVPPNWVANERIERNGVSYAIIMPARERELFDVYQPVHIHFPEYLTIEIQGKKVKAKIKVSPYEFKPKVHFDEFDAERFNIKNGDEAIL